MWGPCSFCLAIGRFLVTAIVVAACGLIPLTEEEIAEADENLRSCLYDHLDWEESLGNCYDQYYDVVEPNSLLKK